MPSPFQNFTNFQKPWFAFYRTNDKVIIWKCFAQNESNISVGVHVGSSLIKVKDTNLINNNQPVAEILCWRLVQWLSWCRTWRNDSWHSNFTSALFCLHSSAQSSGVSISCYFTNSEPQRCFGCSSSGSTERHPCTASFDSWVTFLFVGLHGDRMGSADWCKNKFQIWEYSPKIIEIVGVPTAHQCQFNVQKRYQD